MAVLNLGINRLGQTVATKIASELKTQPDLVLVDSDQSKSAAAGAGYSGSLNLSVVEARDLGAALGCDFYFLGDAQTLRRSPSDAPTYFESYATIFLVSARTGKLITWRRPNTRGATADASEKQLLSDLLSPELHRQLTVTIRRAQEDERNQRQSPIDTQLPVIEAAPDDEKQADKEGLQLPRPFRRLIPTYTESAAEAEAEGTVDVLADIDAHGDVMRVEIARWAGFGLDESTKDTVKRLQFFPAQRDGRATPIRVLLRYNFRKPTKQETEVK